MALAHGDVLQADLPQHLAGESGHSPIDLRNFGRRLLLRAQRRCQVDGNVGHLLLARHRARCPERDLAPLRVVVLHERDGLVGKLWLHGQIGAGQIFLIGTVRKGESAIAAVDQQPGAISEVVDQFCGAIPASVEIFLEHAQQQGFTDIRRAFL